MKSTYFAIVEFDGQKHEWAVTAVSPISALNKLHQRAQCNADQNYNRKVVRRKLRHDEYSIARLFIRYADGTSGKGETVTTDFDLPTSDTPDLFKRDTAPLETLGLAGMPPV